MSYEQIRRPPIDRSLFGTAKWCGLASARRIGELIGKLKGKTMNQNPTGSSAAFGTSGNPGGTSLPGSTANAKVEDVAHSAHTSLDKVADKASAQVDRLSGTAHKAVDSAAGAASSAAEWASGVGDQAKQATANVTDAACSAIRSRPISTVAGALVIGYLLGRIGS
ncbi:MAG: hypothetical protein ABI537_14225 [Casimicrobiaceae bacterium]